MTFEGLRRWSDDIETWKKLVGGIVAIVLSCYGIWQGSNVVFSWYLERSALAADVRTQQQQYGTFARLVYQKQEIDLSREIRSMEPAERAGRLSNAEQSYLDSLRKQLRRVQEQLKTLGD